MFRSKEYVKRYKYTSLQLDTPIDVPVDGAYQRKSGCQFTINDISPYFAWYNAYFEVDFKINELADGANFVAADALALTNDAASIIDNLQIRQNGKPVYDGNRLYRLVNVKKLLELSKDYFETTGTNLRTFSFR